MKRPAVIMLLASAQFVMVLDTTVMNVAVPTVVKDLDTTVSGVQLAITLYALVMGAFMLVGGKIGDLLGRKRAFSIGLVIYGIGSLTTSLAPSLGVLLIGWSFIEGFGAVLVIPAIAALTAGNYEGKERVLAYGVLGGIAAAGAALGPLIGGICTQELTWRIVFAAETVVCLAIIAFRGVIADSPLDDEQRPGLDIRGGVLSVAGLGLVVLGILKSSSWGLILPRGALTIGGHAITPLGLSIVPFMIVAGLALVAAFLRWEEKLADRGGDPLIHPSTLHIPQLRAGVTMLAAQQTILAGVFFVVPIYLQIVLLKTPIETGVALMPLALAMVVTALAGPRMALRSSPRHVVYVGLWSMLAGAVVMLDQISTTLTGYGFALGLVLFGAGIGLLASQMGNVIMSAVGSDLRGEAAGLQGTFQNIGTSLGTALIGAVLLAGLTTGFQKNVQNDHDIPAATQQQLVDATASGVDIIATPDLEKQLQGSALAPAQMDDVVDAYTTAQLKALKASMFVAALLVGVGFLFARRLPSEPFAADEPAAAA